MFTRLFIVFIALAAFLHSGCKEEGPFVNLDGGSFRGDTSYRSAVIPAPQVKKVLIEEFTGVRCVNCPRAHQTIKTLEAANPGRLYAVGIHTGIFSTPYEGRADFRTPVGNALEQLMGGAPGYPSGVVDRKFFDGESRRIILDVKWSNYVNNELNIPSPVNIELQPQFDFTSRALNLTAKMTFTQAYGNSLYFTVYLIEDSLVEHQLTPQGVDTAYIHNHVLRQQITQLNGQVLRGGTYYAGQVIEHRYNFTLPMGWNSSRMKIIGFVHSSGEQMAVLNTAAISIE